MFITPTRASDRLRSPRHNRLSCRLVNSYLRREGYVFIGVIYLFYLLILLLICLFIYLVCLFVSWIMQKLLNRFSQHFTWATEKKTSDYGDNPDHVIVTLALRLA